VGITHAQFNSWQPQRGDQCFAVPRVAHLIEVDAHTPHSLRWEVGEMDDPAAMI
jgi:sulfate transport system ATP-binding protein